MHSLFEVTKKSPKIVPNCEKKLFIALLKDKIQTQNQILHSAITARPVDQQLSIGQSKEKELHFQKW